MKLSPQDHWTRLRKYCTSFPSIGLSIDLSRLNIDDAFFARMDGPIKAAFRAMEGLEKGEIANPDEKRMVGHYWLRDSSKAPTSEIRSEIDGTLQKIRQFAQSVQAGKINTANIKASDILIIGIGGSALGPQLAASALGDPSHDQRQIHFFDNTDPDGFDRVLSRLQDRLNNTLCIVISKSGGTKETRNGMLEAQEAYRKAGVSFAQHAIAVTGVGSDLDRLAAKEGWLERFPMWDWVGGRTSELSAVGLLPAALQSLDIDAFLSGARACDALTRLADVRQNPAALLALAWFFAGEGKGKKDMVIIPYKDRLELFSKYLQQLVMESLGKELDLKGNTVNQGIAVYGNKGSTDQHAYVQQLREGVPNFFVTFIRVLRDRKGSSIQVDKDATSGDYLHGFLLGTREALSDKGRESITLTIREMSAFSLGVLIALYERAVGLYANLIGINAYHQPGVEAGKKAAESMLALQRRILEVLRSAKGEWLDATELSAKLGTDQTEAVFLVCEHMAANPDHGVRVKAAQDWSSSKFSAV